MEPYEAVDSRGTVLLEPEVLRDFVLEADRARFPFVTDDGVVVLPKGSRVPATGPVELARDMALALELDPATAQMMADAKGIAEKADSMKKLNDAGKEHEEFKIRIKAETDVRLANIQIQGTIAQAQASVLGEALKSAKIDIVGGEATFFDKIISGITRGKAIDATVDNSEVLGEIKTNLLNGENGNLIEKLKGMVASLGLSSEDVKNLSIAALILATREPMVVADCAKEDRHTDLVDRYTGYRTRDLIGMPILNEGRAIGVIQLVNALGSPFVGDWQYQAMGCIAEKLAQRLQ